MAFFAAGAWWTESGQAFATEAEAKAFEASGQGGGSTDDEFARAMGSTAAPRAPAGRAPVSTSNGGALSGAASGFQGAPNAAQSSSPAQQQAAFAAGNIGGAGGAGGAQQVLTDRAKTPSDPGLFRQLANTVGTVLDNPVVNPIGYGLKKAGQFANDATGLNISGYVQDPVGQGLADLGAPDLAQAAANPTGYIARQGVNANNGYGTLPGATLQGAANSFDNIRNDAQNTAGAVRAVPQAVAAAARGVAGALTGTPGGGGTNAASFAPTPMPQPSMTPQQLIGMAPTTARPSSAQQDAIVQQMLAQSQVQSGYQDFNSPQYDASRGAAMGYTSNLAGLANNNVAVTGLDAGRYDQSRGTLNQITGQLQNQANNNVGDIQANAAQRDSSRANVLGTAEDLRGAAYNDVDRINADQNLRASSGGSIVDAQKRLSNTGMNTVQENQADQTKYDASTAQQNQIIQMLIAQAQQQEGPSAAESLMLNAQERATRNAYGDASSIGGGWRSQLTGQRQAMGRAAAQQADIAAQIGALRANEAATFRGQSIGALNSAGGYAGDIAGRDQSLSQSDAALLAQIRQGNQTNFRESNIAAGNLGLGMLNSDTAVAMSDADRAILAAQGNQANRTTALGLSGQLQTGAMNSDTNLAQSNASLLAQIRQGNQLNSLNSLNAAGGTASNALNADLGFATNDASIRTQRELANQSNALNAMQAAANAANQTAGLDANIGMNNSNNRVTVDQNNRQNSITALQNAGVLSSNTRAQDVQLSVQDSQALTSTISAAAGLSGTQYAAQLQAITAQNDLALRQRQFNDMIARMPPPAVQQLLSAAGPALGLLGLL